MRKYKATNKEQKRKGQAEKVHNLVKKHGPLTTSEIIQRLKSIPKDNVRFHVSDLFRGGFLAVSK